MIDRMSFEWKQFWEKLVVSVEVLILCDDLVHSERSYSEIWIVSQWKKSFDTVDVDITFRRILDIGYRDKLQI